MDVEIVKPVHQEISLKIEDLRFAVDQFLSVSFAASVSAAFFVFPYTDV